MKISQARQLILGLLSLSPLLSFSNASVQSARAASVKPISSIAQFSTWPKNAWTCSASVARLRSPYSTSARLSSAQPHFDYRISASYSAKGHRLNAEKNIFNYNPFHRLNFNANGRLEKNQRPKSGQDSFFVGRIDNTNSVAFGVADGVGGWQDSGIDPADFAHGLCEYMAGAANGYPEGLPKGPLHPKDLLQVGYHKVIQDKTIVAGGSTACVATAEPDGHVEIANLGDSGFIHFSLNAVRYVSDPQTHAFNTPYQLSKIPQRQRQQMALFDASSALADLPRDANVTHHRVQHGDVLVFASDGVWDNLSPQDLLGVVSRYMIDLGGWVDTTNGFEVGKELAKLTTQGGIDRSGNNSLQAVLAIAVTREAKEASLNMKRDGPFAKEVHRYFPNENWHGGKADDICVVVAIAVEGTEEA